MLFIITLFYQQNMLLFMWLWDFVAFGKLKSSRMVYRKCCERSQQNMKTENEPHETETRAICQQGRQIFSHTVVSMSLERLWFLMHHHIYSTSASGALESYGFWLKKLNLDHQEMVPVGLKNLWILVAKLF